jgi:hypothetical protein
VAEDQEPHQSAPQHAVLDHDLLPVIKHSSETLVEPSSEHAQSVSLIDLAITSKPDGAGHPGDVDAF